MDVGPQHNDAPGTGKEPSELPSRGIVCGAHNFEVGDSVVVSLPGAVLPGDFAIAARKTYGHTSDGMICSARELGIGEDHSGIIVLDQWLAAHGHDGEELPEPGTDAIPLLGLGEEVLEINITPDRGYCFSMRGVAREYSHSTGAVFTDPADGTNPGLYPHGVAQAGEGGFAVEIPADPRPIHGRPGADRYVARVVRGIDPAAPSPAWMRERLTAAGMRPISLAVDVTNYVMLDLGQPLHAFDLAKVHAPIVVRRAEEGESLTFLDEVTRELDPEDLVIADSPQGLGSRPLVLAGVFGGAAAEVDATTTDVLIEAAHFDAVSIARSARRHKLPTESSKRNERGVDTALAPVAAQRAVDLLVEYGGGTADPVSTDVDRTVAPAPILIRSDAAQRLTGVAYGTERVSELLTMIGCTVKAAGADEAGHELLAVTPPTWRPDLVGAAHFAEEVARLDGYDNIPVIVPTPGARWWPRWRTRGSPRCCPIPSSGTSTTAWASRVTTRVARRCAWPTRWPRTPRSCVPACSTPWLTWPGATCLAGLATSPSTRSAPSRCRQARCLRRSWAWTAVLPTTSWPPWRPVSPTSPPTWARCWPVSVNGPGSWGRRAPGTGPTPSRSCGPWRRRWAWRSRSRRRTSPTRPGTRGAPRRSVWP